MPDPAEDIGLRVQNREHQPWVHECLYFGAGAWHKRRDNYCPDCGAHWSENEDVEMPVKLQRSEEW